MPAYSASLFYVLPYPTFYSLRKSVWGEFLTQIFGIFKTFSRKLPVHLLGSTDRTDCGKLPCRSDYAPIFLHKVMALRKVEFLIFDHFLKLLDYLPKSEILVSIEPRGCVELPCIKGYSQVFSRKRLLPSEKSNC